MDIRKDGTARRKLDKNLWVASEKDVGELGEYASNPCGCPSMANTQI